MIDLLNNTFSRYLISGCCGVFFLFYQVCVSQMSFHCLYQKPIHSHNPFLLQYVSWLFCHLVLSLFSGIYLSFTIQMTQRSNVNLMWPSKNLYLLIQMVYLLPNFFLLLWFYQYSNGNYSKMIKFCSSILNTWGVGLILLGASMFSNLFIPLTFLTMLQPENFFTTKHC